MRDTGRIPTHPKHQKLAKAAANLVEASVFLPPADAEKQETKKLHPGQDHEPRQETLPPLKVLGKKEAQHHKDDKIEGASKVCHLR